MTSGIDSEALTRALVARGLLSSGATPPPRTTDDRPWFVGFLMGAAGWLAALFALTFVAVLFDLDSGADYALPGLLMLGAALGLYYASRAHAFLDQLALALSLAGQIAITVALGDALDSAAATASLVAVLQALLLMILPNRTARVFAAFFASIAWALALRLAWWDDDEPAGVRFAPALLGWIAIWLPIAALSAMLVAREAVWMARGWSEILRPLLTGSLLALCFGTLVSEPSQVFTVLVGQGGSGMNWLAIWPLLAVGAALYAGFMALRVRNRALVGVAIVAALLHVMQFYFVLGTTLLLKSMIMAGVGLVLLAVAAVLGNRSGQPAPEAA
jgi:hypothetical protein